ncbi:MAG: hypothetical protein DPW11_03865 [bacterium]|nr:hypothetical protein [bacterium]
MEKEHLFASALPTERMAIYDLVTLGVVSEHSLTVPLWLLYVIQRAFVLWKINRFIKNETMYADVLKLS